MRPEEASYLYVGAFVEELARAGIRHACICPGSRSTPLVLLLADHPAFRTWTHVDERSAAFFALGLAKMTRNPVAIVCTSGTAAANFLPAVVEAYYARVPLLVLTADRPPEQRDVGAPQTIDQLRLYGAYTKWFVEMMLPEATADALRYVRTVACRAVSKALESPPGPVHLNFPFREPLVPIPCQAQNPVGQQAQEAYEGRPSGQSYSRVRPAPRVAERAVVKALASDLIRVERGLIVCGPQDDPEFPAAVSQLAKALQYPVLADPLSLVRCGSHDRQTLIDSYDAFLRYANLCERFEPQVVLRFGGTPTSKSLLMYLQRHNRCRQILVDGGGCWNDPTLLASDALQADARILCQMLIGELGLRGHDPESARTWCQAWREVNLLARQAICEQLERLSEPFEGKVFSELAKLLPDGATLYVGNSMPVRDLDSFFPSCSTFVRFLANRGVNGIDGVVSSALGASAATSGPLVLVIGDLSFYHDMNGLLAAKVHRLRATIIVLNNDGGGIFSFLPQARYPERFEELFVMPHGLDFGCAAEMYGAAFSRAQTWEDFRAAVLGGLQAEGLTIIEMRTERDRNVKLHGDIWQAVRAALDGWLELPSRLRLG